MSISLGGNYISSEGIRQLEVALGITQNIHSNTPVSAWRESAPITPLLLNRGLRCRRPSTAGRGMIRRSLTSGEGSGRLSLTVNTASCMFPPTRRTPQASPLRAPLSAPPLKPLLVRRSTLGHVNTMQRPTTAFFDNKYGDIIPSTLTSLPSSTSTEDDGCQSSSHSSGRSLVPLKNVPLLAGSDSQVKTSESLEEENEPNDLVEEMCRIGNDVAVVSEDI